MKRKLEIYGSNQKTVQAIYFINAQQLYASVIATTMITYINTYYIPKLVNQCLWSIFVNFK